MTKINVDDEWTTVQKTTRRRRPQRRRYRNCNEVQDTVANRKARDVSDFFRNAVATQLRATVHPGDSVTLEEIETALEACLQELKSSQYFENLRQVLNLRTGSRDHPFRTIVCYGVGNFGTKRPSAPMWQLALAILIRDYIGTTTFINNSNVERDAANNQSASAKAAIEQRSVTMHYFEPLMTVQESILLEKIGVRVIQENERGKRSVNENRGDGDENGLTLFYMPHCPMSLYTNVFHANWGSLDKVMVFGNSLNNYIDGGNVNIVMDSQKRQALEILQTLQPFWDIDKLRMNKKDISDKSAYFEQAFNDSSFTSFATKADGLPAQPKLDNQTNYDGKGEVL